VIKSLFIVLLPFAAIYGLMRIHWLLGSLALLGMFWVIRKNWREVRQAQRRGDISSYSTGSDALNWALALAHPMAFHAIQDGFSGSISGADDALTQQLRPQVLHHLGLPTDLIDSHAQQQLPDALRQRWFMLDLQRPHRTDDLRAAMAFACARVAFFVRSARMLNLLSDEAHLHILLLNAQRAQECFGSWQDFGSAYARGRAQWLAQGRADVLGKLFSEDDVAQWVGEEKHPWHAMPWQQPLI
jgi:hypothetical protein